MPFYYYGGKRQLLARYPRPAHATIIEPFAGSAAYSMAYLPHVSRVVLVEKDARVVELWRRLLAMEPSEVLALPLPEVGSRTSDFLHMTSATSNAVARCTYMTVTPRMVEVLPIMYRNIAAILPLAKDKVEVIEGDYREAPDAEGTWFIDPPYQVNGRSSVATAFPQGQGYARDCDAESLDFDVLGQWCKERRGQVIVCEQKGAGWLPFRPLALLHDSVGRESAEVVWEVGDLALFPSGGDH